MQYKKLTPCDFCQYHVHSGCTVGASTFNCKRAKDEFYAYLARQKKENK